jgi:hypothetical protein
MDSGTCSTLEISGTRSRCQNKARAVFSRLRIPGTLRLILRPRKANTDGLMQTFVASFHDGQFRS